MIKEILIKFILASTVAAACLFFMSNDYAYTAFLRARAGIS